VQEIYKQNVQVEEQTRGSQDGFILATFKEHVRRKYYKSSEKAGLLHISDFSVSFSFVLFF